MLHVHLCSQQIPNQLTSHPCNVTSTKAVIRRPQHPGDQHSILPLYTIVFVVAKYNFDKPKHNKSVCVCIYIDGIGVSLYNTGLILGLHLANERRRYKVYNAISHWLGANLGSALEHIPSCPKCCLCVLLFLFIWAYSCQLIYVIYLPIYFRVTSLAPSLKNTSTALKQSNDCLSAIDVWLTHWGRNKMAAIFQTTFLSISSSMKIYKFWLRFHWNLFPRVQWTYSSTGSDNGLVPSRRQAIIWTSDG